MVVENEHFVNRLIEYVRAFYYEPWEWFELLSLGLIVASLFVVIVRSRENLRRSRATEPSAPLRDFRGL